MDDGQRCPECGSVDLEPAGDPAGSRAVCARCGRCWERAGAGAEVDTLACPGCARRGTCESRPTALVEEMTRHHVLADGTPIVLRPLLWGDRFELAAGFSELSLQSRRLRFLSATDALEPEDLDYLTDLDYHDHFAWAALLETGPYPRGIGVARYIRDADDPTSAEVAVTVRDDHQRRGVGTLLTRALTDVAAANGLRRLVSYVLWENEVAIDLLGGHGATVTPAEPGIARVELELPPTGPELDDPVLHQLLRFAADHVREALATVRRVSTAT